MDKNLLFQEITVEEEFKITGGKSFLDRLKNLFDVDIDLDLNLNFEIENVSAKTGDLIATDGGRIEGSSSGGISIGNIG